MLNEIKPLRIEKTCKECKKPFSITKDELTWLEEKGLAPFERCSECRKKRREANNGRKA